MAIIRHFQVLCDGCGFVHDATTPYSEDTKELARRDGWRIGNYAKCPNCLGTDPDYHKKNGFTPDPDWNS